MSFGEEDRAERGQHLRRRALEQPAAAAGKQGVAAKQPVLLSGNIGNVAARVAGHIKYRQGQRQLLEPQLQQMLAMQAQAKANQRLAREGVKQAAHEASAQWAGGQAAPLAGRRGIDLDEATQCLVTAATKRVLMGDFELTATDEDGYDIETCYPAEGSPPSPRSRVDSRDRKQVGRPLVSPTTNLS